MSGTDVQPEAWVTLLVLLGAGALWLALQSLRHLPRRSQGEAAVLTAVVLLAAALTWTQLEVPTRWITVLHEGTQLDNLAQPFGDGHHAGSVWTALIHAVDSRPLRLRSVVRLNATLMVAALGVLLGLGRMALGWPGALAFLGLLVLPSPLLRQVTMSEVPAGLIALLVCVGAGLVAGAQRARLPGRGVAIWLLAAGAVLSEVRLETVPLLWVPALAVLARRHAPTAERLRGVWAWLWPAGAWSQRRKLGVGLLVVVSLSSEAWINELLPSSQLAWVAAGVALLSPSALVMPVVFAGLVSMALVVLALAGAVRGLRDGWALGGLVAGTVVTWRTCYEASHLAPFEIVRYSAGLLPAVWVLGLAGVGELRSWLARLQVPHASWALGVGLALCWGMPPVHGTLRARVDGKRELRSPFLSTARQVEARFLLEALEAHPDCRIYSRITPRRGEEQRWQWVSFGVEDARVVLDEAPGAGCALFYRGSDCNRADAPIDACTPWQVGEPLRRAEVHTVPYNDPKEWGRVDRAVFALYRLDSPR